MCNGESESDSLFCCLKFLWVPVPVPHLSHDIIHSQMREGSVVWQGKYSVFLQSSSEFPLSLSQNVISQNALGFLQLRSRFSVSLEACFHVFSQWVTKWEILTEGGRDCQTERKMDGDRRMLVFQNLKRRENLGHFSCEAHNIHALGKAWAAREAGAGRVRAMMSTATHDYIQIPD